MLRVGLTGGLGSGKSTAAAMFVKLGVHLIEADAVGREMMQPGRPVFAEIVQHFGTAVVQPDGTLNRRALAEQAFQHGRLEELNHIVHPPVVAAQEEWARKIFSDDPNAIAMVESALIFEADRSGTAPGWRQRFDRIVVVNAPDEVKIERYVARMLPVGQPDTGRAIVLRQDAIARLAAQIPDSEKARLADYVIDNSGSIEDTQRVVERIFVEFQALAEQNRAAAASSSGATA